MITNTETLERHINQNGVKPGGRKLEQFRQALQLRGVPKLYSQDGKVNTEVTAFVKIFDPSGSWTWFITEWDGEDTCFGLVKGHETELGYMNLREMARVDGRLGIGLEIDVHFLPTSLYEVSRRAWQIIKL